MFEITLSLVSGAGQWNMNFVLPALQTTLANGAGVMGQTLQSLISRSWIRPATSPTRARVWA